MPSHVVRKFTLFDAMVIIAATAVGFVPIRYLYDEILVNSGPEDWTLESIYVFAMLASTLTAPILITWSAALWVLRLRKPRPKLWQVYRQPGMIACTVILTGTLIFLIKLIVLIGYEAFQTPIGWRDLPDFSQLPSRVWGECFDAIEICVPVVWIVLWLGRVWRSERSWIDRAGRVLGIYCVVCGFLFGWMRLFG